MLLYNLFHPRKASMSRNRPAPAIVCDPVPSMRSRGRDNVSLRQLTDNVAGIERIRRLVVNIQESTLGANDVALADSVLEGSLTSLKLAVQLLRIWSHIAVEIVRQELEVVSALLGCEPMRLVSWQWNRKKARGDSQ